MITPLSYRESMLERLGRPFVMKLLLTTSFINYSDRASYSNENGASEWRKELSLIIEKISITHADNIWAIPSKEIKHVKLISPVLL